MLAFAIMALAIHLTLALPLVLASALLVAPAQAADWKPQRPITLIVPYSPGGGTDALARFLARELARSLDVAVNVENHPGADGLIGSRRAIDARPDGHTLLVQLPSLLLNRHTPGFKGTDPATQLLPVSAFAVLSGVVGSHSGIRANTMSELMAYCKTAVKPCSFGTTENTARMRARMLAEDVPSMVIVNYKGGGQLITDLVSRNLDVALMGYTAVIPHLKSGTLKLIMTVGKERSPVIPEVPASVESGFPNMTSETWYAVFAPPGTPGNVIQTLAQAVQSATREEGFRRSIATLGATPIGNTPEQFARMLEEETRRLADLVRRYPIQ
ncbi:MAG: Bug family tripartite tricarboxylate transporter substrate binding protein [Burkholderiaceae bacterium]